MAMMMAMIRPPKILVPIIYFTFIANGLGYNLVVNRNLAVMNCVESKLKLVFICQVQASAT